MRIFNADGSEAEMCGNGIRCLAKFICELGFEKDSYRIETALRCLTIRLKGDLVSVEMGNPVNMQWHLSVPVGERIYPLHYLDTGVPHAVLFVEKSDAVDLTDLGPKIRHHPCFHPSGTNFSVGEITSSRNIRLRTYERGVEGETLACGTGATAVALAGAYFHGLPSPITVTTRSKEQLEIAFQLENGCFSHVVMTGPAHFVYRGSIQLNEIDALCRIKR
jgi:diaminopimelate epimerase